MDAVALVGRPGDDLVQEHDLVLPLAHGHVEVLHAGKRFLQVGQLVVVRGEQRAAADVLVQVLDHRPGQRHAVVGARAAADLVEDHQAPRRGRVEDAGGLGHLDHERALPARQLVAGADAGEDAVGNADRRLAGRHEAADLRHEREQGHLADVRALAGHVRAGDQQDRGSGSGRTG